MPTWDELFKQEEFRWKEPHPRIVELVPLFKKRGFHKIYDLGCGTGRHLVFLAREGFEVYGSDISETGLEYARRWLEQERLQAELKQSDMISIPYPDGFFDALISIFVIYHTTLDNMKRVIAEIHRVLRSGGLAFLTFPSKRSYRYGQGEEIEKDTFIPNVGPDAGIPHHFSDKEEIETLLKDFKLLEIKLKESIDEQGRRHSHWEVLAER